MVTVAPTIGAPLISVTVPKTSPLLCGLGPGFGGKEEPEPPQPPSRAASTMPTAHKMRAENRFLFFPQDSNHPDIYRYPSSEETSMSPHSISSLRCVSHIKDVRTHRA